MKGSDQRHTIRRKEYRPPGFLLDRTELEFDIAEDNTRVHTRLFLRRNPDADLNSDLYLDGNNLELELLRINGQDLNSDQYQQDEDSLTIPKVPDSFELESRVLIHPDKNTALEGLYQSGKFLLTQCEAEGFRKITYYPDRPDVMSCYQVTLRADKRRFPVLLSNGNAVAEGELEDGRHWARWYDPFPKPSYLFALVAGDLHHIEDHFVTKGGRYVTLRVYVEKENLDRCQHAMESLKRSMQWDEVRFGLEYDLDVFNIVATNDFNMGAMENKSLNIFNSKYVLARQETATDADFQAIEGVIGHEYFHNWTGNRVTCRDWFQLTLKEGLTVYRDQEFSSDMQSRSVKRIQDVRDLRRIQFAEDAGPMAHPIRPNEYIEVNNFYTPTVYEKGAEIIRMYSTLLGQGGFRKGLDLYFKRHDGHAVTCDDFMQAMADANQTDLSQFYNWYKQAGTPVVKVTASYHRDSQQYTVTLRQENPAAGDNASPLLIPFAIGMISPNGEELPLHLEDDIGDARMTRVLRLTDRQQSFVFNKVPGPPIPSLLRNFSAPVKVEYDYSREELATLMANDTDAFSRWEASVLLSLQVIFELVEQDKAGQEFNLDPVIVGAFHHTLVNHKLDPALAAQTLTLPEESYIADQMKVIDVDRIHRARNFLKQELGKTHKDIWQKRYKQLAAVGPYRMDSEQVGRRSLRNCCLEYLVAEGYEGFQLAHEQLQQSQNMTDTLAALKSLVHAGADGAQQELEKFEEQWRHDALVLDKWFTLQATNPAADTLQRVEGLREHPSFKLTNPNKVRALLGSFAMSNPTGFHHQDGDGYRWLARQIRELDKLNPQVAARMAMAFNRWKRFNKDRQILMKRELEGLMGSAALSPDLYEIVSNALK